MQIPRPGPEHARLERLVGAWSGPEAVSPSPFGPGGSASGRMRFRFDLDGMALLQDYEQATDGETVFRGHGVFLIEAETGDVLWWWFDNFGFPPVPARGRWNGDTLELEKTTPRGDARYRFALGGDLCGFVIENRFAGQDDFAEFLHGDYVRDA